MKRYFNVSLIHSSTALLWFRVLDLHPLGLFALVTSTYSWLGIPASAVIYLIWLSLPYLFFRGSARGMRHYQAPSEDQRMVVFMRRIFVCLPQTQRAFWHSWGWTLINWLVKLAVLVWVLRLFIEVPVAAAWIAIIATELTSVLPIHSVAGAGTYEAGIITGLLPFGVSAAPSFKAAVNVHLFLLASTLLGGAVSLLFLGGPRTKNPQALTER